MERSSAIAFGRMVTSHGKTYVPLRAEVPEGGSVQVNARTTGGHPVPAKILSPWGHEEKVLVVPALLATLRASVLVRDARGALTSRGACMVRPSSAFFKSLVSQNRHGTEILWYEGIDEQPCGDATYVELERIYTDFETSDVLHGTIEFTGRDPETLMQPFEARMVDAFGRAINGARLVVNRDDLIPQSDGKYVRSARYSQTIAHTVRSFTLWVRHPSHHIPDGFLSLDAPTLAFYRNMDAGRRWSRADGRGYHNWYVEKQQVSALDLEMERHGQGLRNHSVSLLVDLDAAQPSGLEETLASLENQTQGNWELIGYGRSDCRERTHWYGRGWQGEKSNVLDAERLKLGIHVLTPADALMEAEGRHVGLVDAGDTLEPDALFKLCEALDDVREDPGRAPAMAYGDQDVRCHGGDSHSWYKLGFLKTDFDLDYLYATGGTGRPALVDRDILDIPAIAKRHAEGRAFDLELALAAVESGRPIRHVRQVLYHRLDAEGLTLGTETAPAAGTSEDERCRAVLEAHFARTGIDATIRPNQEAGAGRCVDYATVGEPLVSIIIPNKDSVPVLRRCLESIEAKSTYRRFEVIVVENNSTEPETFAYYETLKEEPRIRVIRFDGPFNFSAICNLGAREAKGGMLLFLNNDTEVIEPRWIELLLGPLMRGDVGLVGAHLLYPDGLLQHGGVIIQAEGPDHLELFVPPTYDAYQGLTRYHTHQSSAVTGACVMVPREVFEEVGCFDERLPIAYNDVQLCISIREAGYGVAYEPRAKLWHYESYSRGLDYDDWSKVARLVSEVGETMLRWTRLYAEGDPFYDHRLAYHNSYFTLGWSPSLHAVED